IARYPGRGDAANDRVISNREEQGISERDRRSVLSLGAMTCRTILRVQEMEVRDLARRKDFRIRPGAPAGIAARHAHQSREDGDRDESGGEGYLLVVVLFFFSILLFNSTA